MTILEATISTFERHHELDGQNRAVILEALREKAERENPQPLTLDELRQMDDKPVWIKEYELYGIVDVSANFGNLVRIWSNAFYCVEGQDDFTAYRFPPKEAKND